MGQVVACVEDEKTFRCLLAKATWWIKMKVEQTRAAVCGGKARLSVPPVTSRLAVESLNWDNQKEICSDNVIQRTQELIRKQAFQLMPRGRIYIGLYWVQLKIWH